MKLILASSNQNKINEIKYLLPGYDVRGLKDYGIVEEIPEPGRTIEENSILKAKYVAERLKDPALYIFADDSGLEVEQLNGAPGVRSARYAGEQRSDDDNISKLLNELKNASNRKAKFVTVIALIKDNKIEIFEGEISGTIAHEPRGQYGFGYDPVFIPQGYRSTFAELKPEIKNAISHRAMAVQKLVEFMKKS